MSAPPPFDVTVNYAVPRTGVPAATSFRRWAIAALSRHVNTAHLAIRLVDEPEGHSLNRAYRGKDAPTNVLSFPAERPPGLPGGVPFLLLGDLVICTPVVAREAHQQGKPLTAHYAHLTIHGVLHLLGFDHENDAEAETMEHCECEILASLGIADPYRIK